MAGCFGSSKEDRYFERQLDKHLDSLDYHGCTICEEARAETSCARCKTEMCEECATTIEDLDYCLKCVPDCILCGDQAQHKCERTGEYCCGPEIHDCVKCENDETSNCKKE